MSGYTHKRLTDVEDSAPKFGLGDKQESRFAKDDLAAESVGLAYHRFTANTRQPFGHSHTEGVEEIYVVVAGSGRMGVGDDVIEVQPLDAVRVSPELVRAFEAGPDGLDVVAFGVRRDGDGELAQDWWPDDG
jgi:mannose-6-phosphate isomerase-like protein (cupin superfamily)